MWFLSDMKQLWYRVDSWLDTWAEYPSHAVTLIVIGTVLGGFALYFAFQ